jgi:replicative DNA helicase
MTQRLKNSIETIMTRNPQADDREILFQMKQLLYETELQYSAGTDAKSIADLVAENMQQIKDEAYQSAIIKSGFDELDRLIGGFRLGEFVVVGGRPSMGKTLFLVNLSLNISPSFPTLYVTLDLSEFLLTSRFIASVSGIPTCKILEQDLTNDEKNRLSTIGNEFAKRQLFIHDSANSSIATLKANCLKQIKENGVQLIIVDYLQLITSYHHRKYRELEVSFISRELKNLAKEHNVCVIASSQLSRNVENRTGFYNKRPQLSDLRESGAIEQDADKVIFIHRPEYYGFTEDEDGNCLANLAEIMVAKNRNGRLGDFYLSRDKNFTNFRNFKLKDEFEFSSSRLLELEVKEEAPF